MSELQTWIEFRRSLRNERWISFSSHKAFGKNESIFPSLLFTLQIHPSSLSILAKHFSAFYVLPCRIPHIWRYVSGETLLLWIPPCISLEFYRETLFSLINDGFYLSPTWNIFSNALPFTESRRRKSLQWKFSRNLSSAWREIKAIGLQRNRDWSCVSTLFEMPLRISFLAPSVPSERNVFNEMPFQNQKGHSLEKVYGKESKRWRRSRRGEWDVNISALRGCFQYTSLLMGRTAGELSVEWALLRCEKGIH